MNKKIAASVIERDQGRCQFPVLNDFGEPSGRKCGSPRVQIHHRLMRSQGGGDTEENLILLCDQHHEHGPDAVHVNRPLARELGLIVPSHGDPSRRPWMEVSIPLDGY